MICNSYSFVKDGKENKVYTLSTSGGFEVDVLDYGARSISVRKKNSQGDFKEFVVGPEKPEDYYKPAFAYNGATVGRYANRIGEAKFTLNGKEYLLNANQNGHCLHGGGDSGFHNKIWNSRIEGDALVLELTSPDGAGGFPGETLVSVKYSVNEDCLTIEYSALSNKDTHCNLTNHAYFTLNNRDTRRLYAYINSNEITKFDKDFVARGEFSDIIGTAYSFNPEKQIGKDIADTDDYFIRQRNGYDTNYCINRKTVSDIEHCAYVYDKESKMRIDCYSTMPGFQFYATKNSGKLSEQTKDYNAFCLEPQYYPNTPNCPTYPSTLLKAGVKRVDVIVYKFSM